MSQILLWNCNTEKKALLTLNIYIRGLPRRIPRGTAWSGRLWWRWECDIHTGCWPQTCSTCGSLIIVSIVTSSFLLPTDCILFIPGLLRHTVSPLSGIQSRSLELHVHSSQTWPWVFHDKDFPEMSEWLKLVKAGTNDWGIKTQSWATEGVFKCRCGKRSI